MPRIFIACLLLAFLPLRAQEWTDGGLIIRKITAGKDGHALEGIAPDPMFYYKDAGGAYIPYQPQPASRYK